jgi:hypothetical protein
LAELEQKLNCVKEFSRPLKNCNMGGKSFLKEGVGSGRENENVCLLEES